MTVNHTQGNGSVRKFEERARSAARRHKADPPPFCSTIVREEHDSGSIHESRTTWEVRQDGSAIRTVLAWNLSAGFYDTVVTVAQWRTNGSQLTITYLAPSTGTAAFTFSVNGDILTIGPDQFSRVR